jgi:hypothetical protein
MNTPQTPDPAAQSEGGLKIIGAGFGRTGTLSLKVALEELGFGPCYHMIEVFQHPEHANVWRAAAEKRPHDWKALLAGYQATVDWPGCAFYAELMEVYPDAKVILTVRDPEKWHDSVMNTIYQGLGNRFNWFTRILISVLGFVYPSRRNMRKMHKAVVWEGTFHGRTSDKEYAIKIFEEHNAEVQRRVPPEKLLVFQAKDGWEPLCAFLNVPVPVDKPYPHLNDRANFGKPDADQMSRLGKQPLVFRLLARLMFPQRQQQQ